MPYTKDGIGYQKHSPTSKQAAIDAAINAPKRYLAAYRALVALGRPSTAEEIAKVLKLRPDQVKPRLTELKDDFMVTREDGDKGETSLGCKCAKWSIRVYDPNMMKD